MKRVAFILFGILIGFLLGGLVLLFNRSFQGSAITLLPSPTSVKIIVYITVAVQNPGVYQINPQSRVEALIELAGGLVPSADQTQINLAAKLYDGQHLIIPSQTEDLDNRIIDDKHPLNVNSATLSELDLLPGIGEAKAQAIIAYRDRNGLFSKIEDIMLVPGIGVNLFNQIKSFITVSDIIPLSEDRMSLKTTLEENLKEAMRNNRVAEKNTIRMVLTSIKLTEIEKGKTLEDNEILAILQKEIKMRQETIQEAEKGNRQDIIKMTRDEIGVLETYLPKQMSIEEVQVIISRIIKEVEATGIKDMGKVMKIAIPEIAGKASNDLISQTVKMMLTEKK